METRIAAEQIIKEVLDSSLPKEFDFYGETRVRIAAEPPQTELDLSLVSAVGYQVYTLDEMASFLLVLFFGNGLDSDLYLEMGNVIAGKLATELETRKALEEIFISPPHRVRTEAALKQILAAPAWIERHYQHVTGTAEIPMRVRVIPMRESNAELGLESN